MLNIEQVNRVIAHEMKREKGLDVEADRVYVLAIRGNEGANQIGVFDDRSYVVYDHTLKGSWKWNTDPSSDVPGRAHLMPGVYPYQAGKHHMASPAPKGRAAFIQAGPVKIRRTGGGIEEGFFGINLHDATSGTTSSLGCQTAQQYGALRNFFNKLKDGFRDVIYRILGITPAQVMANPQGYGKKIWYILIDAADVAKILK